VGNDCGSEVKAEVEVVVVEGLGLLGLDSVEKEVPDLFGFLPIVVLSRCEKQN
jgi:hypothetical protein